MEIAKGIYSSDYFNLDLEDFNSEDWTKAIEILRERITKRFLEPIEKLIELEFELKAVDRNYGFTILALDCMLLETLQCFYEGKKQSNNESKEIFKRFLTNRLNFKEFFDEKLALKFYKDFRCGILHQLQTFNDTKIWSVGKMIFYRDKIIVVNRNEFHKNLRKEFDIYLNELGKDKKLTD